MTLKDEQKKRIAELLEKPSQKPVTENGQTPNHASGGQNTARDSDRHRQTSQQAADMAGHAIAVLNQQSGSTLTNVQAHIHRLSTNRSTAVEQVSDVLAYLHDPRTLYAEIMQRTNEKLGLTEPAGLDFGNPYEGFDVPYPALSPVTVAGCLPM